MNNTMIKRFFFLLFLGLTPSLGAMQAQEMEKVFITIPDQYIPQLEDAWRKDLVDLYKAGKEAKLQNTMNGTSVLKQLTNDYMLLQTTERSTVELKLLPLVNNTYIVCMVTTVQGPVADSRVDFYSTDWKPLPSADIFQPVGADWFLKSGVDTLEATYISAMALLDIELIKYSLSPDSATLTAEYTTPLYLSEEARTKVLPYLKEGGKVYTWKSSRFE